jgi:hypothetical protein
MILRLPDLPNAGYATTREKQLTDSVMMFMREIERDRLRLLSIVCDGREKWVKVAGSLWRGLRIGEDSGLLHKIYDYFCLQACPPSIQYQMLQAPSNVLKWRELIRRAMPDIEVERELLRKRRDNG